jgi:hypothetical protein
MLVLVSLVLGALLAQMRTSFGGGEIWVVTCKVTGTREPRNAPSEPVAYDATFTIIPARKLYTRSRELPKEGSFGTKRAVEIRDGVIYLENYRGKSGWGAPSWDYYSILETIDQKDWSYKKHVSSHRDGGLRAEGTCKAEARR